MLYWITPTTTQERNLFLFLRLHCRYFPFDHHSLLNFLIPGFAASFMHNVLVWTMRFNLFLICFFLVLLWGLNIDEGEDGRGGISNLISAIRGCVISTCNLYRANNYKWEFIDSKLIRPTESRTSVEGERKEECTLSEAPLMLSFSTFSEHWSPKGEEENM